MLSVDGAVRTPFEISYDEILNLSRMDLAVTLECAGNPVGGGLISNARWTGVGLSWLLGKAQPLAEARSVRMWGADQDPQTHGSRYYRSIPLAKALDKDTLTVSGEPAQLVASGDAAGLLSRPESGGGLVGQCQEPGIGESLRRRVRRGRSSRAQRHGPGTPYAQCE